jgi:hypothetical protein
MFLKVNQVIPKTRNEIFGNGTEKFGLKHGNRIFEHGTFKIRNKKLNFLKTSA